MVLNLFMQQISSTHVRDFVHQSTRTISSKFGKNCMEKDWKRYEQNQIFKTSIQWIMGLFLDLIPFRYIYKTKPN